MVMGDTKISSRCGDCGEPIELAVTGGKLEHHNEVIHFSVAATDWWKDVVYT
jgi:hypothetical protein